MRRLTFRVIASYALFLAVLSSSFARDDASPQIRLEFAARMAQVKEGMSKAQVLALVGKPDSKIMPVGPSFDRSVLFPRDIWLYGVDHPHGFPTLGQICFDTAGHVLSITGNRGIPPDATLFSEAELRSLLQVISLAPPLDGWGFDPRKLIIVVNALQPLGKEKALAVIGEFLRITPSWDQEGVFLVLHALFDVPADLGPLRSPMPGAWSPPEPTDRTLVPDFPLVIEEDIPIMLESGYMMGGPPPDPAREIHFFREHGTFRTKPLTPTDRPLEVLAKLEASPQWLYGKQYASVDAEDVQDVRNSRRWNEQLRQGSIRSGRQMIRLQLLRLVKSAYSEGHRWTDEPSRFSREMTDAGWSRVVEKVARLGIRWDRTSNDYTVPDARP